MAASSSRRLRAPARLSRIADLEACRELDLRSTAAREVDILRAVQALPRLVYLALAPGALRPEGQARLRGERPALVLR